MSSGRWPLGVGSRALSHWVLHAARPPWPAELWSAWRRGTVCRANSPRASCGEAEASFTGTALLCSVSLNCATCALQLPYRFLWRTSISAVGVAVTYTLHSSLLSPVGFLPMSPAGVSSFCAPHPAPLPHSASWSPSPVKSVSGALCPGQGDTGTC